MNRRYINLYVDFLRRSIRIERPPKNIGRDSLLRSGPLKVVFDCSNGTTGLIIKKLFTQNSSLITHYLNKKPDGNFPAHGPDPLKRSALGDLRLAVLRHKADIGVIFDADGDRVFFIDNKGRLIDPDIIARLLIWQLNPKKMIIDVRTGWLIKKIKNQKSKIKIIESKVGHYFIKKLMRKVKADFGAERSGHYYFKINNFSISNRQQYFGNRITKIFFYDSGIMAAIEVLNAVSKLPYTLSDFVDLSPQYYRSGEINIKNSPFERFLLGRQNSKIKNKNDNAKFKNLLKKIETYCNPKPKTYNLKIINHIDGLTMEFDGWWFNVRSSNTEPLLRLNIEAESLEILKKEKNRLTKFIKSAIK